VTIHDTDLVLGQAQSAAYFLGLFQSAISIDLRSRGSTMVDGDAFVAAIERPGFERLHAPRIQVWSNDIRRIKTALTTTTASSIKEISLAGLDFGASDMGIWTAIMTKPYAARLERLKCGLSSPMSVDAMALLVAACPRLVALDVSTDSKALAPETILFPSLRRFTLHSRDFHVGATHEATRAFLKRHPRLTHVQARSSRAIFPEREQVTAFFKEHPALEVLRLDAADFETSDAWILEPVAQFVKNTIRRLHYSKSLGGTPTGDIVRWLGECRQLQTWQDGQIPTNDWSTVATRWPLLQELVLHDRVPSDWRDLRPLTHLSCLQVEHSVTDDILLELTRYHPRMRYFRAAQEHGTLTRNVLTDIAWNAIVEHWPRLGALDILFHDLRHIDLVALARVCSRLEYVRLDSVPWSFVMTPEWQQQMANIAAPIRIFIITDSQRGQQVWGNHRRWTRYNRPDGSDFRPNGSIVNS
jgi:hypothetical protein